MSTTRHAKLRTQNRLDFARARRGEAIDGSLGHDYRGINEPVLLAERIIVEVVAATRRGMPDEAVRIVSENQEFLDQNLTNVEPVFVWAYEQTLGIVTNHSLEYEASLRHLSKALSMAEEMDEPACKYPTMIMLGRTLQRRGDIAQSIRLLIEINRSSAAADNIVAMAQSYLGELFTAQGHHEIALKHRLASIDESLDLSVNDRAVLSAGVVGAYVQLGCLDEATALLGWTRAFSEQGVSPYVGTATDLVESFLRFEEGEQGVARELAQRCIIEFERTQKLHDEMRARLHLARIELAEGELDKVEQFGADERIERMEAPFQVQVLDLLAAAAKERSDWQSLTEHQDEILRLEDLMGTKVAEVYPLLREFEAGKMLRQRRNALATSNDRLSRASAAKQRLFDVIGQGLHRPLHQLDQRLLDYSILESRNLGGRDQAIERLVGATRAVRRVQAVVSHLNLLADPEPSVVRPGFTHEQVLRCLRAAEDEVQLRDPRRVPRRMTRPLTEGQVARSRPAEFDQDSGIEFSDDEVRLLGVFENLLYLSTRSVGREDADQRLPKIVDADVEDTSNELGSADVARRGGPTAGSWIQTLVGGTDHAISNETLQTATRQFFAADASATRSDVGDVGLSPHVGLAVAWELARSIGGTVACEQWSHRSPNAEPGTAFRVRVPFLKTKVVKEA